MRERAGEFWEAHRPQVRKWSGEEGGWGISLKSLVLLALWWGALPLVWGVCWLLNSWLFPGVGTWHQFWYLRWVELTASDAGVWGISPWFWTWIGVGLVVSGVVVAFFENGEMSHTEKGLAVLTVVLGVLTLFPIIPGFHDSDKDEAYFYLQSTTVYVKDMQNPPSSLRLMFDQKKGDANLTLPDGTRRGPVNGVLQIGPVRVMQGAAPVNTWLKRNSSYDGAKQSLNNKTGSSPGSDIFDDTITYVYGNAKDATGGNVADNDRWSAVLDGSKNVNPTIGVAEWRGGQNVAHVCRFDTSPNGSYRFTRAFHGGHMNSLTNVLALKYPDLVYQDEDIAGYCDSADRPVIVISVTRKVGWRAGTELMPAGILDLRGSPSGEPVITYKPVVGPGEYPVPVYPLSIARQQRETLNWIAGRGNLDGAGFGFEPSTFSSQAGNNGEYVLRNKLTGSIVAYTPLTALNSKSQRYINVDEIGVDSVHDGQLNPLSSYFQDDTDVAVDPQGLDSLAQLIIRRSPTQSNFISSGGKMLEYVPTGPNTFRGYGEDKNGVTVLYVDLVVGQSPKATVVSLDANTGREIGSELVELNATDLQTVVPGTNTPSPTGSTTAVCAGKDARTASTDELRACLRAKQVYEDELIRRLQEMQRATPAVTPSTSPSPTPAVTK